ncbi:hypothetical protein CI088_00170 [Enterococcus plantarum]|uniref:Uncharacterized protein n=1 Tax=Enterococcus plantarum TaxID=1077675 RepID=A0A2W4BW48_9ENTE|nr:hypothetical protein [Enterococcus plantarum]PZL78222.1 hypothetical protein CI088_00170 [Enterococcus plantarum]
MTEKTIKHELYKHGSYLISLKESGSKFVNIDDEIKKLEELFQLASKKDQSSPVLKDEKYYVFENTIFKVLQVYPEYVRTKELTDGKLTFDGFFDTSPRMNAKPATAEDIKRFKVAEAIEKSGLTPEQHKRMISDGKINIGVWSALQTTAEELQEVDGNE